MHLVIKQRVQFTDLNSVHILGSIQLIIIWFKSWTQKNNFNCLQIAKRVYKKILSKMLSYLIL